MKRKLAALLLTASLGASVLSGCGSNEENVTAPGDSESPEADAGEDGTEEPGEASAEAGEPDHIVVALMSFSPVDSTIQDRIEAAVNEKMVEAINVEADFQWYDTSTFSSQVPMMIQSGEQLDAMMFIPVATAGFTGFMGQGQLLDITDYVDEYGTDIKAVLGEEGLAATTRDGRLYGVGANLCHYGGEVIIMRQDVLDEIGMADKFESMTTWTEMEEILTAAVAAGYTGMINSDADGSCISPQPFMNGSDKLDEAYWVDIGGDGGQQVYIDPADDTVKCYYMNEDYKKNMIRAGDWYTKGLIYKDASTAEEFADQQLKNGVGVAMVKVVEFGWESSLPAACGGDVAVKFTGGMTKVSTSSYTKFGYAVPVTAQEPEAAVKFLNLLYSKNEIHDMLAWGQEGVDWVRNEDGTAGYPDGKDSAEYHMADFLYGDILTVIPWEGGDPDVREQQAARNAEAGHSKYIGFSVDNTNVTNQVTACQNVTNEYKPMLSSGVYGADTEAKYEEYVKALEGAGMNEILAEYQSQLDAWLAQQ